MGTNEELAMEMEAERERREAETNKPARVSRSQVKEARFVWMAGVTLIDALTAWLIFEVTGFLPYAIVWVLAGAGGLLYSERLKERVGNNQKQMDIGDRGVKVSAVLVAAMALFVGTVWITHTSLSWIDALMEITAVTLFMFHLWQSYTFHSVDEEIVAANEEARNEEENEKNIRAVHRAARIVTARKRKSLLKDSYRKTHGPALDQALINLGFDVPQDQGRQNNQPNQPKPQQAFAADTKQEALRDNHKDPTPASPDGKKQ